MITRSNNMINVHRPVWYGDDLGPRLRNDGSFSNEVPSEWYVWRLGWLVEFVVHTDGHYLDDNGSVVSVTMAIIETLDGDVTDRTIEHIRFADAWVETLVPCDNATKRIDGFVGTFFGEPIGGSS